MFGKKDKKNKIKSWYSSRYQMVLVQRNILFLLAVASTAAVIFALIFVKYITASKSFEPYVIEIEEKTGIPTVVDQKTMYRFTSDASLKRYFLNKFIVAAEGYNPFTYKEDLNIIRLFSSSNVFRQIYGKVSLKNPNSIASKVGLKGNLIVHVKSLQFKGVDQKTGGNKVQIRVRVDPGGRAVFNTQKRHLLIDLVYSFVNMNLSIKDRHINPLGFQVKEYLVTDELVINE